MLFSTTFENFLRFYEGITEHIIRALWSGSSGSALLSTFSTDICIIIGVKSCSAEFEYGKWSYKIIFYEGNLSEKCFRWDTVNCSFWTEFDCGKSSYKVVFYEGDLSEKCCKPALDRSYCGSARGNLLYLQLVTNEAQRPIILRSGISICSFKWNFQTDT